MAPQKKQKKLSPPVTEVKIGQDVAETTVADVSKVIHVRDHPMAMSSASHIPAWCARVFSKIEMHPHATTPLFYHQQWFKTSEWQFRVVEEMWSCVCDCWAPTLVFALQGAGKGKRVKAPPVGIVADPAALAQAADATPPVPEDNHATDGQVKVEVGAEEQVTLPYWATFHCSLSLIRY